MEAERRSDQFVTKMSKISCFTVNKLMSAVSGHVRSSSASAGVGGGGAGNPSPSPKRRAKPAPNRRERSRRPQEQRGQEDEEGDEWELAVHYGSPARSKSNVSLSPAGSACPFPFWSERIAPSVLQVIWGR